MRARHALPLLAAILSACATSPSRPSASAPDASGGSKRLTLDLLYDPKVRVDFSGRPRTTYAWIDGESWLEKRKADGSRPANGKEGDDVWFLVQATTGAGRPSDRMARAARALATLPTAKDAHAPAVPPPGEWSADGSSFLVQVQGDLWLVNAEAERTTRLTHTPELEEEEATFSPDSRRVAFVAANDLWVADARSGAARALTTDGSATILNGKLDWLYQEEVFGRGTFRAYWWSPDSASLAFLRLDETHVPPYTLVDDSTHVPTVETSPYPRPGEPNPVVKLGLAAVEQGTITFVDLSKHEAAEPLVVDVSWSPANEVLYCVQDREQTWLELHAVARDGSNDRLFVRETSPSWVERNEQSPMWLADGSYLWMSERSGFKHLFRYQGSELVAQITSGEWEVRTLHGVDQKAGLVYFSGTERSVIGSDAYAVRLDGTGLVRLTEEPGTHNVQFSPDFSLFVDAWSDLWTPTQVRLRRADGSLVRVLDDNPVEALSKYAHARPELHVVKTRDGFEMNATLVKPLDFDARKKYPVLVFVYSGPHSQTVRNAWGGTTGMFQQLLAQHGVLTWSCDNRTSSGRGARSTWPCYLRLGESELADIEDGVAWLKSQGFVDDARVGITGWSYGGFMSSYALTHSRTFSLGIAGGSVTDWRSYDSIYTERFMKLPKNNEKGYDETSVVKSAKNLHGKLVLVHGQIDDNVHPQNTLRLAHELQKLNADFELMLYPTARHGVVNPLQNKHWRATILRALRDTWGIAGLD